MKKMAIFKMIEIQFIEFLFFQYMRSDEEIIENYKEIESEALALMQQNSTELDFSWQKLITEGIHRRRSMDVNMKAQKAKMNKPSALHKNNLETAKFSDNIKSLDKLSSEVSVTESSKFQ
jgi:hypothetical protein